MTDMTILQVLILHELIYVMYLDFLFCKLHDLIIEAMY